MIPPGPSESKKVDPAAPQASKTAVQRIALLIATAGGAGYSPVAPGTVGTFVTIPLAWALGLLGNLWFLVGTVVVTAIGIWAAGIVVRLKGKEDPQIVVVDEVAGYLVTLAAVERDAIHLALAFFVFRFLDIWKPGPARWADQQVHGGLGVVLDDLFAGAIGAVGLLAMDRFGATAWLAEALATVIG